MRTIKSYKNRKAQLYKITCKINNWVYWGMTYTKGKTYLDRFEEHINGKGGKFLYQGILKHGKENFTIELVEEGNFEHIRDKEIEECKNTMYQKNMGWNGNVGKAIFNDDKAIEKSRMKRKNTIKNRTPEEWERIKKNMSKAAKKALYKRKLTISKKTKEDMEKWRNLIRKDIRGKTKENCERILRQSESLKKRWKNPTEKMIAGKIKEAITKMGQNKYNNEAAKKRSERMMGRNTGKSNTSWKSYWCTPFGKFETLKQAADSISSKNLEGVKSLCLGKYVKITKILIKNYNLNISSLGRHPKDIGFYFIPKN